MTTVRFPETSVDSNGADLLQPAADLLKGLKLLPEGAATDTSTPESVQIMTAGALSLSKWEAKVAKVVAGGGFASIATGFYTWINGAHPVTQAALILGGCGIVAAAILAISFIVRADLAARALGTAAQYEARGAVAVRFLEATEDILSTRVVRPSPSTSPPPAGGNGQGLQSLLVDALGGGNTVTVTLSDRPGKASEEVVGLSDGVGTAAELTLADGTTTPVSNVSGFNAVLGTRPRDRKSQLED